MDLLTLGYQGLRIDQLFPLLMNNKVKLIIDVREMPISRKPGFSKTALAAAASGFGIKYMHMRSLGCPKEIRHAYATDRNWRRYARRFEAHLDAQAPAVAELEMLIERDRSCLLCFEDDPSLCHRSLVAQRLASKVDNDLSVSHLTARDLNRAAGPRPGLSLAGRSGR